MTARKTLLAVEIARLMPDLSGEQAESAAGYALSALARLDQQETEQAASTAPAPISASATVRPTDLVPGRLVQRWTDTAPRGTVRAPLPCHEAQSVTVDPTRGLAGVAVCRSCSASFDLEVEPDGDGGYWANFTVAHRPYLLSRARRSAR